MVFPEIVRSRVFRPLGGLAFLLCIATPLVLDLAPAKAANEGFEATKALNVIVDKAKVVRIAKPADTIIIGNPSIVDATIQDARTLVLTGRNFGITNLIILDADGDVIVDETVVVQSHETNMVRIYRQASRETLACAPVCENTVTVGDNAEQFQNSMKQINDRAALSKGQ
ncbi:MAG: pilus assembly protein N-terminal domain-containing protein [Pseudomonadota bacterium]